MGPKSQYISSHLKKFNQNRWAKTVVPFPKASRQKKWGVKKHHLWIYLGGSAWPPPPSSSSSSLEFTKQTTSSFKVSFLPRNSFLELSSQLSQHCAFGPFPLALPVWNTHVTCKVLNQDSTCCINFLMIQSIWIAIIDSIILHLLRPGRVLNSKLESSYGFFTFRIPMLHCWPPRALPLHLPHARLQPMLPRPLLSAPGQGKQNK